MSSLSEKSRTLLEMIDELVDQSQSPKSHGSQTKKNNFDDSQDIPLSPKLSDQMKTYLQQRTKVPEKLKRELIQNQEKIDLFVEQKSPKQSRKSSRSQDDTSYRSYSSSQRSPRFIFSPSKQENETEITMNDEAISDEKRISALEMKLSIAEQNLKQEREIRELLLESLNKTVTTLSNKCVSVKPTTTKTIAQMMSRMGTSQAKVSTARLLDQQIDQLISEIPPNETVPSPILESVSPKKNSSTPELDVLVRGCSELANSLSEGFYDGQTADFGELAKTPIDFARQINQIKKAHDVGVAELRAQIQVLTDRTAKMEELEAKGEITEETQKLVNNLTQMMKNFSEQSRKEYEDLLENME